MSHDVAGYQGAALAFCKVVRIIRNGLRLIFIVLSLQLRRRASFSTTTHQYFPDNELNAVRAVIAVPILR